MVESQINAFDSFTPIYRILVIAGFYKPLTRAKFKYAYHLNYIYRAMVHIYLVLYNLQHLVYIGMAAVNKEDYFDSLMIEIPQFNLLAKAVVVTLGIPKLEELRRLMYGDPIFAANNEEDRRLFQETRNSFRRLMKAANIGVTLCATFWVTSPVLDSFHNRNTEPVAYFPFNTTTTTGLVLSLLLEHGPVLWTGYGHLALDILVACHYTQATVQLKIIKNNLKNICKGDNVSASCTLRSRRYPYLDELNSEIKERFINNVKRYETVVWFVGELNSVFNKAISCQFITSSCSICLVIYKLTKITPGTFPFAFLAGLIVLLQFQIFVYCYCGEMVKHESKSIVESMYESEWLSLSPRFRKMLLIAMSRWILPITPKVAYIIPLSLTTFVVIIKGALNLYTVLKKTN